MWQFPYRLYFRLSTTGIGACVADVMRHFYGLYLWLPWVRLRMLERKLANLEADYVANELKKYDTRDVSGMNIGLPTLQTVRKYCPPVVKNQTEQPQ